MKAWRALIALVCGIGAAVALAEPRSLVVTLPTDANVTNEVSQTLGPDDIRGYLDQIDFYCPATATGIWSVTVTPKDTSFAAWTLVTTNAVSNNVTVRPRINTEDRYMLVKESIKFAVTNVSDSNLTWKARIKWDN